MRSIIAAFFQMFELRVKGSAGLDHHVIATFGPFSKNRKSITQAPSVKVFRRALISSMQV
jgi:hypothetical protein